MPDIFDYLNWRGDLSLQSAQFNAVDGLILSRLSYLPFDGMVPAPGGGEPVTLAEAAQKFMEAASKKDSSVRVLLKNDTKLLKTLSECPRFSSMKMLRYVNNIDFGEETQFSAVTILTGDGSVYIAYRGTDDTLAGWKEDFNMSFLPLIPAQQKAVKYLEQAAAERGPLRTGGHSKGGNLAVYAAAFCSAKVQKRITDIYNNDGPGFSEAVISHKGYKAVLYRIHTFIPQSSVVGMLFEHEETYTVVHTQ